MTALFLPTIYIIMLFVLVNDLVGQCQVVLGPCRIRIVQDGWDSMAWRFAQFDISLDDGLENQFLKMSFDFIVNLIDHV